MKLSEKIEKNKHYNIEITDIGTEGEGIGKIDNIPVFVENATKGDIIEVRIVKVKKNYAYGKLISFIKKSKDRIEPACDKYPKCGGCNLQHISYEAQLKFKTQKVKNCLERIGGFKEIEVNDTIGAKNILNYRNKAQFPVGIIDGKTAVGFYAKRSHRIIESENCLIQNDINKDIVRVVKAFMEDNNIEAYDEERKTGVVRHILTRIGNKTGEISVMLVINDNKLKNSEGLVDILKKSNENIVSIMLNINKENTNVILGKKTVKLWGRDFITDYIGELKFEISPMSFYQVNPEQTRVLYEKALEYAGLEDGKQTVIDAYCGIGTISLFLAKKAKKVYGVEIIPEAIENAKRNAEINNIKNAEFFVGKAEEVIPEIYKRGIKADTIVVDPPRKGCDEKLLKTIIDMKSDRVVYVSCDPATLARDLKYLCSNGYEIEKVQPVDMFCFTSHVESVVLLKRIY